MLLLLLLLCVVVGLGAITWRADPARVARRAAHRLRRALLSSPTLRRAHPDVYAALETWRICPCTTVSHTDPAARTIHLVLLDHRHDAYDANTLIRVLAHEACHAAGNLNHDAEFFDKQDQCLAALAADGILDVAAPLDTLYPAFILPDDVAPSI